MGKKKEGVLFLEDVNVVSVKSKMPSDIPPVGSYIKSLKCAKLVF